MKKIIYITSSILVLLVLMIALFMTNKTLTKDEFISLIKSFDEVTNVKLEGETTKYIKNGIMHTIGNDNFSTWANSNTKECISYNPSLKQYAILEYMENDFSDFSNSTYEFIRI